MTGSQHPSRETLRSFQLLELGPEENAAVVRHLLTGCRECRAGLSAEEQANSQWQNDLPAGVAPLESERQNRNYGPAFKRLYSSLGVEQVMIDQDRRHAEAMFAELMRHPYDRQRLMVLNSERFISWTLAELLISHCFEGGFEDAERAYDLARLSVHLTTQLPEERYGAARVADLRARAWGHLANAMRIRSDFRSPERALRIARHFLQRGTDDPLERAKLIDFEASLRVSQRRFDEAVRKLDEMIAVYRENGETHLEGRGYLTKGRLFTNEFRLDEAIQNLRLGFSLIDEDRDPRLAIIGKHSLATCLAESGRAEEAAELVDEIRRGYQDLGARISLLRIRWIEGKIARRLNHEKEAELAFLEVREAFIRRSIGYDAALVSLELAELYASQGRTEEVRQIAIEIVPIFQSRDVHDEALAAIAIFRQAAERDRATVSVLTEVADYLKRSRHHPEMRMRELE